MTAHHAPPPDLEMRVKTVAEHGRSRLAYTLHSPAGVASFSHLEIAGPLLLGSPEDFQARLLEKIGQLGQRLDVDGSTLLGEEIERKLASLGRDLWRELFPAELRHAYREIRQRVRSWSIVSDEPWIPWELIKPYDDSIPGEILDDDFLAFRFALTRWLAGGWQPPQEIVVRSLAALRTATDLPQSKRELRLLKDLAGSSPGVLDVMPAVESAAGLLKFLESEIAELIHFVGHGTHESARPDESGVPFPDGSVLRPADLAGPVATRIGRVRPLVFLNVCWGGQQGRSLTRLGGWAARWVGVCRCGAFVAPMWPVRDQAGLAFARAFYGALARGETLGQAALEARRHVRQQRRGDPSALAYTVYGDPNGRVLFGRAGAEKEAATESESGDSLEPLVVREQGKGLPRIRLRSRRDWVYAAASVAILLLLAATTERLLDSWKLEESANTQQHPVSPEGPTVVPIPSESSGPAALPKVIPENHDVEPTGAISFKVTGDPRVPKSVLVGALQQAASPLAARGISGWTISLDVGAHPLTSHIQDGQRWEECKLTAQGAARGRAISFDLGPLQATNSQLDGVVACQEAAQALAEEVIHRLVTFVRKGES